MKVWKTIGKILVCLLVAFCVGINAWYIYVKCFGPDKIVSFTYEVGLQNLENSEDSKYFIEINYLSNEEGNGLEVFEIKYNYMLDEDQTAFYSQGLQYVGESTNSINFEYCIDKSKDAEHYEHKFMWPVPASDYYKQWGGYRLDDSASFYQYASADDYEHVVASTNPMSSKTAFKIQLGDDLFLMQFKNENTEMTSDNYMYRYQGDTKVYVLYNINTYYDCYAYYDYNYFSKLLYEAVQTVPSGTNSAMVFEFGDIFTYAKYNEEKKQYDELSVKETEKVKNDIKSYYSIKVTKSASGAVQASDSLFGAVNGSTTYNKLGTNSDDYFIGRSYLNVTEKDFDLVEIEHGYCVLKLKANFVKFYSKYDNIILNVKVNLDTYAKDKITILGFATDSGLDKFSVQGCYFLETIDGQVIQTEVAYAK